MALHSEPSKSKISIRLPLTDITQATTQTANVRSSAHKTNKVALPSGLPNIVARPRGHSTYTPIIATTTSLLATLKHTNVFGSASDVLNITPKKLGRLRKFQNTTHTTHTPTVKRTPSLLATPQHSNVHASSSGVSNITPGTVGRPRRLRHTTTTTTETLANTSTPASVYVPHQTNLVESSTTHEDDEDEAEVESQINRFEGISIESTVGNTHANSESYSLCCGRGKVMLPKKLKNPPKLLMDLINKKHQKSTTFIDNIRRYNSMFSFTSMGGKQDKSVNTGRGLYCYRIQGMNCHRMGALLPNKGKHLIVLPLYIYDTENEIKNRIKFSSYIMVESKRMSYIHREKKDLRSETYFNMAKLAADPDSCVTIRGKKVVLPSSYTGSQGYMMQNYLDAMTLCKNFRYPDLFITFTCNPNWPEIARFATEKGLKFDDRPDVITRVFKQKLDILMKDFKEKR
nr:putative PIF1 DNA helicase/replication protein A1-like protein [Tanacetum cinerariifolium]